MKVKDLSLQTFRELDEPSDLSIPAIAFWYQTNIGKLNTTIGANYSLNNVYEIVDESGNEIGVNESAVFKTLYELKYYDKLIRQNLGAASIDGILEVTSDGGTVRKTNKNELAKTYIHIRKDLNLQLKDMVNSLNFDSVMPAQVVGTDAIEIDYEPNSYLNRLI